MHTDEISLRKAVGAQEPVTWINAGGTRLAVMRRGRGAPVICLHAIGHGARDFEPLAERVGNQFEIIALDWPGHGCSPDDGAVPEPAHFADLVEAAMDGLGLDEAILLGNSIGGATALHFAASHPRRVRALVLCNSGGLAAVTPYARLVIGCFVAFFRAGENGKRWFGHAFRFYYGSVLKRRPARDQRERIVASAYEIAAILRRSWEEFALPEADLRTLVAGIACPVWVAWAKNDHILAWSRSGKAARMFPNVKVDLFRGGHCAFLEDPDHFANAFMKFARSVWMTPMRNICR